MFRAICAGDQQIQCLGRDTALEERTLEQLILASGPKLETRVSETGFWVLESLWHSRGCRIRLGRWQRLQGQYAREAALKYAV